MDRLQDLDAIHARLARARWRVASATRGGPEWDAAMDEVEALEALEALEARPARVEVMSGEGRPASTAGAADRLMVVA